MTPLGLTAAALMTFAPPTIVATDMAETSSTAPEQAIGPIEVARPPSPTDTAIPSAAPKSTGTGLLVAAPVFLAAGAFSLPVAVQAGYAGRTDLALGVAGGGVASMAIGATAMYFGVKRNRAWRAWRASRPDIERAPQSGAGLLVGGGTMMLAGGAGVAWVFMAPPPTTGTAALRLGISAGSTAIGLTAFAVGLVRTRKFSLWRTEITSAGVAPIEGGAAISLAGRF